MLIWPLVLSLAPTIAIAGGQEETGGVGDQSSDWITNTRGRVVRNPSRGSAANFAVDRGSDSWCWVEAGPRSILHPFYDTLLQPDWEQLSQGTSTLSTDRITADFRRAWKPGVIESLGSYNTLTDSIEVKSLDSLVLRIRRGVHYWERKDVPHPTDALSGAYGREFQASDIVGALHHLKTGYADESSSYTQKRLDNWIRVHQEAFDWELKDDFTIIWTGPSQAPDNMTDELWINDALMPLALGIMYVPYETFASRQDLCQWKNHLSTGPFIPVDFVHDSHTTYKRNPNYWGSDPLLFDRPLPYLEFLTRIVTDHATKVALTETGMLDMTPYNSGFEWFDKVGVEETNHDVQFAPDNIAIQWISFDSSQGSSWEDERVRLAAFLALDNVGIVNEYYRGNALSYPWLIPPYQPWAISGKALPEYTGSDTLSEYDPNRAQQLLVESGYPDGFDTTLIVRSSEEDVARLFADYMSKIGIMVDVVVKNDDDFFRMFVESSAETSVVSVRSYHPSNIWASRLLQQRLDGSPILRLWEQYYLEGAQEGRAVIWESLSAEVRKRIPVVPMPSPISFNAWQPWVRNYGGENVVRFPQLLKYVAIDADLRQEESGRGPYDAGPN